MIYEIILNMSDSVKPFCIITPPKGDTYLYLVQSFLRIQSDNG